MEQTESNLPLLQSFWYDNEGHTLAKYKYNQVAFIEGNQRFVLRAGNWMHAPVSNGGKEPTFEYVQQNFNPLEELHLPEKTKKYREMNIRDFNAFSDKIMNKGK